MDTAPPLFTQPPGSPKCWAYALASWIAVTEDRTPTGPEEIVKACKNYCALGSPALNPRHVHKVFESKFVRMAWRVQEGRSLKADELRALLDVNYLYCVLWSGSGMSHARVLWQFSDYSQAVVHTDPILGNYQFWTMAEIAKFKLILGFPKESLYDVVTEHGIPWFYRDEVLYTPGFAA